MSEGMEPQELMVSLERSRKTLAAETAYGMR